MDHSDGSRAVFDELQTCLIERRVDAGFRCLDSFLKGGSFAPAELEYGVSIAFCLSQLIDLGFKSPVSLDELLLSFTDQIRAAMPAANFLQLRMIEALGCMRSQHFRRAIFLLTSVIDCGENVLSPYQTFVAEYSIGRAQRLAGDFEGSILHISKALDRASEMQANKLVAVTRIHKSWLMFHNGESEQALKLLELAEEELLSTGHALSLGNISAARGRFIRSSGQYAQALRHFMRAVEIYSPDYADHPNMARALVNAAYVKRLMALELQPRARGGPASAKTHKLAHQLAQEALDLLERAAAIYQQHRHQGGTGSVLVNTGYLQLESGDIEQAAITAANAYSMAEDNTDLVLTARARILQASVELAFCEEQLEAPLERDTHPMLAVRYADHAISLASQTQNRRLLAASYIVRGLVATDEPSRDWSLARSYSAKASALIGEHDRDHLFRELHMLNLRISRSSAINEILQAWCTGDLAGKSFQQVQEDFAEIVIPKVWIRLDRKVSRVAEELSISPKKVRRILRAAKQTGSV